MLSEDMAEAANQECPILDKVYEDQTVVGISGKKVEFDTVKFLSLIHISEPTRPLYNGYAVFCL